MWNYIYTFSYIYIYIMKDEEIVPQWKSPILAFLSHIISSCKRFRLSYYKISQKRMTMILILTILPSIFRGTIRDPTRIAIKALTRKGSSATRTVPKKTSDDENWRFIPLGNCCNGKKTWLRCQHYFEVWAKTLLIYITWVLAQSGSSTSNYPLVL